jgi:hypothetical protein
MTKLLTLTLVLAALVLASLGIAQPKRKLSSPELRRLEDEAKQKAKQIVLEKLAQKGETVYELKWSVTCFPHGDGICCTLRNGSAVGVGCARPD